MNTSVDVGRRRPELSPRPDILLENVEIFTPARRIARGSILMRKGRIAALGPAGRARGADADVVLLDRDLNVRRVFLGGREILIAR